MNIGKHNGNTNFWINPSMFISWLQGAFFS